MKYHCFTCGVELQQSVKFECFSSLRSDSLIKITPKRKRDRKFTWFLMNNIWSHTCMKQHKRVYLNIITYQLYRFSNRCLKKQNTLDMRDSTYWQEEKGKINNKEAQKSCLKNLIPKVKVYSKCNKIELRIPHSLVTWFKVEVI